jgi:hypothetical protein
MVSIGREIESESVVVIFNPRTGAIIHRHHVITEKGGKHPDEKIRERDALHQLRQAQPEFKAKTALLHIDPKTIKPGILYKVDAKKRVLVEQPIKIRRRRPSRQ